MVARLASIADGTKRLQVRVLRWSFFSHLNQRINATFHNETVIVLTSALTLEAPRASEYIPARDNVL